MTFARHLVSVLPILASLFLYGCQPYEQNGPDSGELLYADAETAGFSPERLNDLTADFEQALGENETPGAVALILRDGHIVYERSFGYRTPARENAMTTDTIFRIYSMTKPIVSVATMMLWEEGAFDLNDPIGKYLVQDIPNLYFYRKKIRSLTYAAIDRTYQSHD